ncbi:spore coat polysaccharide biosynthesis protein SpsF [Insolitispirillum peregrinum]|uniref:Spore coat polysaccharide biosynthesis protein SpsF n=2 Tax=Insolitispirillum peregrinum TaxID=80876 RepID=A0A1N7JPE2_9PROT|nr:spore coat polysaccharide biosynthesis protein SpsF [Insolitispirillum peregrinum]
MQGATEPDRDGLRWAVVVQARMGSTRLPGKVLADLAGRPALVRQIERIWRTPGVQQVIVATSTLPQDDAIADLCADLPQVDVFRGSEQDVLSRYTDIVHQYDLDAVMRLTGDCPLIDPDVLSLIWQAFLATPGTDFASNCHPRTFPHGFDCEVASRRAMDVAAAEAVSPMHREHVMPFIWSQPERFRQINVTAADPDHVSLRLTLDYPEDLELIRAVYEGLYPHKPDFRFADIVLFLQTHPQIAALNRQHILFS